MYKLKSIHKYLFIRKLLFMSSHHGSVVHKSDGNHDITGSVPGLAQWVKELWCRSQTWLRSTVAVASGYSSDWTPSLWISICHGTALEKTKNKQRKKKSLFCTWNVSLKLLPLIVSKDMIPTAACVRYFAKIQCILDSLVMAEL